MTSLEISDMRHLVRALKRYISKLEKEIRHLKRLSTSQAECMDAMDRGEM